MQVSKAQAGQVLSGATWVQQLGDDPWPEVAQWLSLYQGNDTALLRITREVWLEVYERRLWQGYYTSWKDVKKDTRFDLVFSRALSAQGIFIRNWYISLCLQQR